MNQDLLPAILAAPDDDRPRLVWADWLEERGEPARAELVRVQCALARAEPASAESVLLRHRERELLARHGRAWLAEVGEIDGVRWTRFERGLLVGVEVPDLATLLARADEIRARAPVAEVTALAPDLPPALRAVPWLRSLTFRELYGMTREQLEPLLDSPLVDELRTLRLVGCGVENPGALAIAASPRLRNLQQLDLTGCFVGEAGGIALARADHLRDLRQLRFGSYGSGYAEDPFVTDDGAAAIARQLGGQLVKLNLRQCKVGAAGAHALAAARPARLVDLSLAGNDLRPDGAQAIGAADWPALGWLDLNSAYADDTFLHALAATPAVHRLVSLNLDSCTALTADGVDALARAAPANLRSLSLSYDHLLGRGSVDALCEPGAMPQLTHLALASCGLDEDALAHLEGSALYAQLCWLSSYGNPVRRTRDQLARKDGLVSAHWRYDDELDP